MKAKKIFTFFLVTLFLIASVSTGLAQEKKKKKKGDDGATGQLILHEDKGDVKVLFEDWKHMTIPYDANTKFMVGGKEGSPKDLAAHGENWPKGKVSYIMKEGKPVATEISFSKVKKKKKK
ncbi:MAG: hypothetical protein Q8P24_20770 [Desulfobacterales bacterium]|nr:hypothetical protein [Desulfobacterales bacterium]